MYTGGPFLSLPAHNSRQPHQSGLDQGKFPRSALVFFERYQTWKVHLRDLLLLAAVILSIPFVIMAFGMPIVLAARLVLWIGSLF